MSDAPQAHPFSGQLLSRQIVTMLAGLVIGGVAAAIMLAFLGLAAYMALLGALPPWQAALAVAAMALVVALIALGVASSRAGRANRHLREAAQTSALALMVPTIARIAARNARLTANLAGLAAAALAIRKVAAGLLRKNA